MIGAWLFVGVTTYCLGSLISIVIGARPNGWNYALAAVIIVAYGYGWRRGYLVGRKDAEPTDEQARETLTRQAIKQSEKAKWN